MKLAKVILIACFFNMLPFVAHAGSHEDVEALFDKGVELLADKQYVTAVEIFTQLANQGVPEAQYNLSILLNNGLGAPISYELSLYWAWYAHLGGHPSAVQQVEKIQAIITDDLRNNVAENIIDELIILAEDGEKNAALNLGLTNLDLLVTPDLANAYIWLSIAQAYGLEDASTRLTEVADLLTIEDIQTHQASASAKFAQILK